MHGTSCLSLSLSAGLFMLLLITLLHSSCCQYFCKPQQATLLSLQFRSYLVHAGTFFCKSNVEGQQVTICVHWTAVTQMLILLLLFRLLLLSFTTPCPLASSKSICSCESLSWCMHATRQSVQHHCAVAVNNG